MRKASQYFLTSLFLLLVLDLFSQGITTDTTKKKVPFIYASYNFSKIVSGAVLPSNGFHSSFGLNIARFFKQKFLLGLLIDYRGFKILGSNNQYGRMTDDINTYFISQQNDISDSTRANLLSKAFNSDDTKNFFGSYLLNFGIMFSPFPDKYGGIMLQVKRGGYIFPIYGAYNNPHLSNNNSDFVDLAVPVDLNIQLTFKPFTFLQNKKERKFFVTMRNIFLFSIFYESISLRTATIDGTALTKYLKPEFFDKYGKDNHFGFKISIGIY